MPDIKERFTNYILVLIVCLRNMEQFSWNPGNGLMVLPGIPAVTSPLLGAAPRERNQLWCSSCFWPDHLWVLLPDVCMVIASEVAVDVVKHAFITKFNDLTADVRTPPLIMPHPLELYNYVYISNNRSIEMVFFCVYIFCTHDCLVSLCEWGEDWDPFRNFRLHFSFDVLKCATPHFTRVTIFTYILIERPVSDWLGFSPVPCDQSSIHLISLRISSNWSDFDSLTKVCNAHWKY